MSGSPSSTQQARPCDYCGHSTALLYCRADSAKLCFSCDREVHSTNQLFSKHTRTLLCDACDHSPATILCSTETSVLCQNCDWERHNVSLSSLHERRPLEGFTGCPSVTELLTIVGFRDIGKKALLSPEESDGFLGCEIEGLSSDLFVWDAPSVVSLDDLISSSASSHNFQAMEVPPMPKNRKAACGRHREEILGQLRELAKSEPLDPEEQYVQSGNLSTGFERDMEADIFPSHEWHRESSEQTYQVVPPDTSLRAYTEKIPVNHSTSAVGETLTYGNSGGTPSVSLKSETLSTTPKAAPCELASQERDSALLRYKQKKKTRRYDKHIRYESRKVRAEGRARVKGRFAKMEH
ncbi:zinc finger protein CONSTANS-LIKE 13 [Abrus precatorius]|uniref:Zinc finger protein CONSTANS-LIKE 13 n=1 Tax=Abrus precatorius TaxID=3816 RepID=A0A8B8L3I7_ABRPR|nr:zinc finger protein CONSTANS-LIKE 13 [Abrus precatorius]XP_027350840.1 zinc finger protein CONSTANS-LIKE 13 [Abrus precatorius]XP_027350841.1 zinc finger protein CONSTANS-LIKE 13 [Abrus precatorius]